MLLVADSLRFFRFDRGVKVKVKEANPELTLETRRRQLHAGCASKSTNLRVVAPGPSSWSPNSLRLTSCESKHTVKNSIGRRTRSLDHAHLITDSRNKLAMTS